MKRTLTVLTVLTLLTGVLFAADPVTYLTGGDKITLNATVAQVPPTFEFYGSMDHYFDASAANAKGGGTIITGINPADDVTMVYFKVKQTELSRYDKDLKVTFKATQLSARVDGTLYNTDKISWFYNGSCEEYKTEGVLTVELPISEHGPSGVGDTYECTLKYGKNAPVRGDIDIIQIAFVWDKKESLPAANYEASVSVTIAPTT